ncbi:MAG: tetratricopeptide repeat protein [Verrucomicrobia bacterium]|nr:tetratricopeptide repeat protein [Verrucomicrobiota bacterium]
MAIRPVVEPAPSSFDPIVFWSLHRTKIVYGSVAAALLLVIVGIVAGYRAIQTKNAEAAFAAAEADGDWQSVISHYPGSTAAGNAYLRLAAKLAADGKYAESDSAYQSFLRDNHDHPLLVNGYMGLAQNAENQKSADRALQAYGQVVTRFGTSYLAPLALFHQARLTRGKGQLKEARELFEKVVQNYPGSFVTPVASQAASELNEKLNPQPPAPAPQAAASASASPAPAASASPAASAPSPDASPAASLAP